jgi:hypothetical protein
MSLASPIPLVNWVLGRFIDGAVEAAAIASRVHIRGGVRP